MAKITGKKVITLAIEAPGEANAVTERYRQRQPRTGFQTRVGLNT